MKPRAEPFVMTRSVRVPVYYSVSRNQSLGACITWNLEITHLMVGPKLRSVNHDLYDQSYHVNLIGAGFDFKG